MEEEGRVAHCIIFQFHRCSQSSAMADINARPPDEKKRGAEAPRPVAFMGAATYRTEEKMALLRN